jgi:hypothetical protein
MIDMELRELNKNIVSEHLGSLCELFNKTQNIIKFVPSDFHFEIISPAHPLVISSVNLGDRIHTPNSHTY